MVFNNYWYTNFVADSHGVMEFQFDLAWRKEIDGPAGDQADALTLEPQVLINPALKEDPQVIRDPYRP